MTRIRKINLSPIIRELKAVDSERLQKEIGGFAIKISEQKFQNAFSAIGMAKYLSRVELGALRMGADGVDDDGLEAIRWNGIFMLWGYTAMVYMRSEHLESGLDWIPDESVLQPFKKYLRAGNSKRGEDTLAQHIRNAFSHGTFKLSKDLHTVTFMDRDWVRAFDTGKFIFGLCEEIYRFYYAAYQSYAGIEQQD